MTETLWDKKNLEYRHIPKGEKAINQILYSFGLEKRTDMDGFKCIGLMNYRSNDDF